MRFITEFEFDPVDKQHREIATSNKRNFLYHDLGRLIGEAFGWNEIEKPMHGFTRIKNTLEIEAFPMDKWVEFKKHLFLELDKEEPSSVHIHELIKELESFGKPEEETTPQDLKKCPHCDNLASSEFHKCPYKEDVNNDSESECNCCEKCTHECAMDI